MVRQIFRVHTTPVHRQLMRSLPTPVAGSQGGSPGRPRRLGAGRARGAWFCLLLKTPPAWSSLVNLFTAQFVCFCAQSSSDIGSVCNIVPTHVA